MSLATSESRRSSSSSAGAWARVWAGDWVGTPLGPALAAVVTYRLFNLILVSVPSLLANRLLHPALAR